MSASSDRPDDQERALAARCLAGDRTAWEAFVVQYTPLLAGTVRHALRRMGRKEDPDGIQDLLQEIFVAVLQNDAAVLRRFRWECPLPQYLMTVAARRTVLSFREESASPFNAQRGRELLAQLFQGPSEPSPLLSLEVSELRQRIEAALESLPPRERLALRWFYWDSLPARDIGRLLSQREDAVWVLLSRARQRLQEALKGFRSLLL